MSLRRKWFIRLLGTLLLPLFIGDCSTLEREPPVPPELIHQITVLGTPNARFWPDTQGAELAVEAQEALQRERAAADLPPGSTQGLPPAYYLAVSGGGDDGAFGSGLLCGWADAGTMPTFKLVTGVSTGAMMAPFAFLGQAYHDKLCAMYTTIKPSDVLEERGITGALFGDSLADTTPLARLISQYVTEQTLADIARLAGRLLARLWLVDRRGYLQGTHDERRDHSSKQDAGEADGHREHARDAPDRGKVAIPNGEARDESEIDAVDFAPALDHRYDNSQTDFYGYES
jgi:hypothetical protein